MSALHFNSSMDIHKSKGALSSQGGGLSGSKIKDKMLFQKDIEIIEMSQECLVSLMFSNFPKRLILEKLSNFEETQCYEQIKKGELCFKCYDCEVTPSLQYICEHCFDSNAHKNHVYVYFIMKEQGGVCYCGDLQTMKSIGTCSRHCSSQESQEELWEYQSGELDQNFRDYFTSELKN